MKYRKTSETLETKSRKEKRKEQRLQKKKNKLLHYKKHVDQQEQQPSTKRQSNVDAAEKPRSRVKKVPKVRVQEPSENQQQEETEDDRIIRMYSEKYGGEKRISKDLVNDGFDSDLFSFLDNITHKVHQQKPERQSSKKLVKKKKGVKKDVQPIIETQPAMEEEPVITALSEANDTEKRDELLAKARKSLNGLLNRVSEGNLAKIFRQVHEILQGSPRPEVFSVLAELFVKFNIQSLRVMINILATQTALVCALHHLHGNHLFKLIVEQVVKSYLAPLGDCDPEERLEQRKNAVNVMAYMYLFGSITVFFVKELVEELVSDVDSWKAELLFQLIGAVGSHIRSDDPKTLKDIIDVVKAKIEQARSTTLQGNKKVGYIIEDLQELRFNKKSAVKDSRLEFLHTFVKQEVIGRNNLEAAVFVSTFQEVARGELEEPVITTEVGELQQMDQELKAKKRYYEELAKDQKMVTEFRKKVFVALITAEDYIEGAEKILQFRSKKHNEVASVIVETCTQQATFNPYYPLVASKLIEVVPRIRPALQFMIWDQLKQLENFSLRKICNLAKFLSRLVLHSAACSLSMLKNFSDLVAVDKHQQIFITAFFEDFFTEVNTGRLNQLIRKVRQGDSNRAFKSILEEYLQQDYFEYCKSLQKPYLDKVKLAVRLLKLNSSDAR